MYLKYLYVFQSVFMYSKYFYVFKSIHMYSYVHIQKYYMYSNVSKCIFKSILSAKSQIPPKLTYFD